MSAAASVPTVSTSAAVRPASAGVEGSSALSTAVPPGGSAARSSPSTVIVPATPPRCSAWASPTLVTTPTSGRAMSHSSARSPTTRSPISVTITARAGRRVAQGDRQAELVVVRRGVRVAAQRRQHRREQVLGRGLPGRARDRDDARIGAFGAERSGDGCSAASVSPTSTSAAARPESVQSVDRHGRRPRRGRRRRTRRATKSWPSRESRSATKHAPASSARESNAHVVTARVRIAATLRRRRAARSRPRSSRSYARLELFRARRPGRRTGVVTPPMVWPVS